MIVYYLTYRQNEMQFLKDDVSCQSFVERNAFASVTFKRYDSFNQFVAVAATLKSLTRRGNFRYIPTFNAIKTRTYVIELANFVMRALCQGNKGLRRFLCYQPENILNEQPGCW